MKNLNLICSKCGKKYPIKSTIFRCLSCGEPTEVEKINKGKINKGNPLKQNIIERYKDFLPFKEIDRNISLGEGFTPLIKGKMTSKALGVKEVYFKNESQNPTWSFKDRGTLLGIHHALKLGYRRIGTVSTGNMAVSVAAYGSKAGLETFVLVKNDLAPEKLNPIAIYNPHLIKIEGDYGQLYFKSLEIGDNNDIYFINSDVPLRVEGSKTIAYEICEQLDFDMPEYIIVPTSAGGNIRGIIKGFEEFKNAGLIERIPSIICGQASGCSPITKSFLENKKSIERIDSPKTIAHAIENPFPPSGNEVLRQINKKNGICVAVDDDSIIKAQKLLAKDGIFGQPASAVPVAIIKKLKEENFLKGGERIVCIVTGSGLKYTAAFKKHDLKHYNTNLDGLMSFIKNNF